MEASVTTKENENGTEIIIETKKDEIAVVVRDEEGERIYLPYQVEKNNKTYYTSDNKDLEKVRNGFRIEHPRSVDRVNVIS